MASSKRSKSSARRAAPVCIAGLVAISLWVVIARSDPRNEDAVLTTPDTPVEALSEQELRVPFESSNLLRESSGPHGPPEPKSTAVEILVTTLDQETLWPVADAVVEIRPADTSAPLITGEHERLSSTAAGEPVPREMTDEFGVARVMLPAGLDFARLTATKGIRTGSAWMDATRRRNVTISMAQRTELVVEVRDRETGSAVSVPVLVARLSGRTRREQIEPLPWASAVVASFEPEPGVTRVVIENFERLLADARGIGDRRVALLPAVLLMNEGLAVEHSIRRDEPVTLLAPAFGSVTIHINEHDGSRFAGSVAVQVLRAFESCAYTRTEVVDGAVRLERVAREGVLEVHLRFPDRRDAEAVVVRDEGSREENSELDVAIADPRTTRTILVGRLMDPAGDPLQNARLVVLETSRRDQVVVSRRPSLVTGAGGEFALALPVSGSGRSVDLYLWSDDELDPLRSRQRATLSAAQAMGAGVHDVGDVRMTLLDELLSGWVVKEDGSGISGARVMMSRVLPDGHNYNIVFQTLTNDEGKFHIYGDAMVGMSWIGVRADGYKVLRRTGCALYTTNYRIELERAEAKYGRIVLPRDIPSRFIECFLVTSKTRWGVPLSSDGTFEVEATSDGDHLEFSVAGDSSIVHRVRLHRRENNAAKDEPLIVDLRGVVFGHKVVVVDADAKPIQGAAIRVTTGQGIVVSTDADGFAELVCASPAVAVSVRAPGHAEEVVNLTTGTNNVRLSSGIRVSLQILPDLRHLLPDDWRPVLRLEHVGPEKLSNASPEHTAWLPIEGDRAVCVVRRPGVYAVRLGRRAEPDEEESHVVALEESSWTIQVGRSADENHELLVTPEQVRSFLRDPGVREDG